MTCLPLAINHFFVESGRAEEVVATSIPPIATADQGAIT
jgi:hypothetical protein